VFPASREYARALIQKVVDSNAEQLGDINSRLLDESIQSATRELFEYKLKFKDDPDPLIQTRIKQIEDKIEALQEELDKAR
jgi:UDP-glucose 6-dehydrogenase